MGIILLRIQMMSKILKKILYKKSEEEEINVHILIIEIENQKKSQVIAKLTSLGQAE